MERVQIRTSAPYTNYIRISKYEHEGHEKTNRKRGALSQAFGALDSPSKLRKTPSQFLAEVRKKQTVTVTKAEGNKIRKKFSRLKTKAFTKHLTRNMDPKSWGAINQTVQLYHKSKLQDFNEHSIYLCGDNSYFDANEKRFAAVLSSENFLLNAYRQSCYGSSMHLFIDTSFRYTLEGWGVMPMMVVAPNQQGHTVGYAICSHDDTEAHDYCMDKLKQEVETVVNSYIDRGVEYV
jgi:hypothetical protein